MKVEQIYSIVNTISDEILGEANITKEDLSNVVDIGKSIFDATSVDNYVNKLMDRIGRMVFVDRTFKGRVPDIIFDNWEYGSVACKVSMNLMDATENEAWSLTAGETYNQDKFYQATVNCTFFNHKTTFEIDCSFADDQVKESFNSVEELNRFFSMIQTGIENSMTIKLNGLIMRTINNMIGQTLLADAAAFTPVGGTLDYGTASTLRCVNLLYLYNEQFGTTLKAEDALTTPAFTRFAAYVMGLYVDYLTNMSTKFNIDGLERFTDRENLRIVVISDLAKAHEVYLQSDVYHDSLVDLPQGYTTIPFWQGSGKTYAFDDKSAINIDVADASQLVTGKSTISIDGVLGVMFNKYAVGVNQYQRKTTSHVNAKGDFYNTFYKVSMNYWNALDEDFVVFFMADAPSET